MIYSPHKITEINKELFLQIVSAIYYKYYLRWVNEFESDKEKIRYTREVGELINNLEAKLKKKKIVEINGYNWISYDGDSEERLKKFKISRILIIAFSVLLAVAISVFFVGGIFWILKEYLNVKPSVAKSIFSLAIILVLVCWVILTNRVKIFEKVVDKLIDLF